MDNLYWLSMTGTVGIDECEVALWRQYMIARTITLVRDRVEPEGRVFPGHSSAYDEVRTKVDRQWRRQTEGRVEEANEMKEVKPRGYLNRRE